MSPQPFEILGPSHLLTLLIIVSIAFLFPKFINSKTDSSKIILAKILGFSAITLELIKPFIWHYAMDFPWARLIPIHMCNLSTIFIGVFLLTDRRIFFEVSFFWGIGGGINALVTPDVPLTFPDPQYILFFVGHGLLIVCIAYACIVLKNRPTLDSVKNGIYFSLAILPIVYIVNLTIGPPANYWYLATKPVGESLLNYFPDPPLHIPLLIVLGTLVFYLIYSPYWIFDKIKQRDAE
ncbi:TIGR02206 family membrane protein [Gammaproteobacteria bacterium]|nr:TIGR02206 family membrane protein [Gammaproteobacteria bacterium]